MDLLFPQVLQQGGVLNTSHAVPNTRRAEVLQGLPHTIRATRLTRVGSTRNVVVGSVAKSRYMCINGITRFVGRDVKTDDTCSPKLVYELNRL